MTVRSLRILRRAQDDLLEIQRYVACDSPALAASLVEALLETAESLRHLPERGAMPRDAHLQRTGYRFVVVAESLILYKVLERQVRVHRVLHGKRRYADLL